MFKEFFVRELRGALSQPMVYIFLLLYALLSFGAVASDNVQIGGAIGNIHKNAPHIITVFVTVLSIFGLLFAAAFFNNAALRDFNNQFHEILFSTPLSKASYFFGRFCGAFILATLPFVGIYLGAWLATLISPAVGWLDADRLGPMPWGTALHTFLIFVLPNMFFGGAIIFWLAHRFRSTVVSFVGALLVIVAYLVTGTLMSDVDNESLAALTDPFGIRTYSVYSRYFTPFEKNTLSPVLGGLILQNRLIWIGAALLLTALSYFSFSTKERRAIFKKKEKRQTRQHSPVPAVQPGAEPVFNLSTTLQQFISFFSTSLRSIIKSTVFKILFLFAAILVISSMVGGFEYYGLQSYPVTYKMMEMVNGNTSLFVMIILVFFSGELVWRDRMNHIDEVVNATPHASFSSLSAKVLALVSVSVILYLFFIVLAILYQVIMGFTQIELPVYLGTLVFDALPGFILYSMLFVFIQVVINNRYIGYFISVLFLFILDLVWLAMDVQSNMINFGGNPDLTYSDMNGFGAGFTGALWFNSYWFLFGLLLLMTAGLFMNRNATASGKDRRRQVRKNFTPRFATALAVALGLWVATAGFVYYNSQVLNSYDTSDEQEEMQAEYEKKYKQYEDYRQPKLVAVNYFIDIFPEKRDLLARAEITLQNKSSQPIDSLFYTVDADWEFEIKIPGGTLSFYDEELGFQIYTLAEPLDTNATLKIEVISNYITKGFENSVGNRSIAANGTFFNNAAILPAMGYRENYEILDKNDRRKYDLAPKKRIPELVENCGAPCMVNYLSDGASDWVDVETVISTSADQVAIAPGKLMKEWEQEGRNYFRYKVEQRSQDFYSFMSARYEVARRKWKGINLEVYYDPQHNYNVEMMLDAIQKSLEYYIENFGPYYHRQARIIEFPRYASFAQAFPGTMPYSEELGFVIDLEDETDNNVIDAVIAHEMAHQWWAHQEIPAKMQGGTMLTESFAEYSALMVMKQQADDMKMKNFLKYDFDRYLRGRSTESIKEVPLYKVENQGYIHYGKGALILYALQDYIGEDSVNAALRDFLAEFRYAEPPYPNSYDFLKYLEPRVPDSLHYLVEDWFKKITLYDFRLKEAQLRELDNGRYAVDLEIEAAKIYADTIGNETRLSPNDWVDIGLYADEDEEKLLTVKRVKFDKEKMTFSLTTDQKPAKAAIDPHRLLIERIVDDNVKGVSEG